MVEAKLGIAVVPMLDAPIENHPALTIRRLIRPSVNRTFFLLKRRGPSLSPAASAVWSALISLFRRDEH
jgi:DNA-binding transcriptional LysR family regulator